MLIKCCKKNDSLSAESLIAFTEHIITVILALLNVVLKRFSFIRIKIGCPSATHSYFYKDERSNRSAERDKNIHAPYHCRPVFKLSL